MSVSIKKTKECFEILNNYTGNNPYIKMIILDVITKNSRTITDFEVEYVIDNHTFTPQKIDKIVRISDWFGEKKREQWNYQHQISKLQVTYLLGETKGTYHCYVNYKRNQEKPVMCFIPKNALMDEIFVDLDDYKQLDLDFSWFNNILSKNNFSVYEHQETAAKFLLTRKRCILSDDMGLGKSMSSIIASILGEFKRVLIICPASLKGTKGWQKQLQTFVPQDDICVIDGDNWFSNKKYTIINYDIIDRHHIVPKENGKISRKKEIIEESLNRSNFIKNNFDLVIIDEVHKISNDKSSRYEAIYDYLKRSKIENIWLLTGTIITKSPINYMNILKLIFHPITEDWEYYVKRYCDGMQIPKKGEKERLTNIFLKTKHKNTWYDLNQKEKDDLKEYINKNAKKIWITSGNSNLEELFEKTKTIYLRRLKSMIPGMKGKKIDKIYYDLNNEERQEYNKLWEEYEKEQRSLGKTSFNQDLTENILMRMAISKFMVSRTIDLVNSFIIKGKKVVIACAFNEEIAELQKYYKEKCVIYKGGVSQKNKDLAEEKFMVDPNTMVFIGNIQAAGVGLTLISSHIVVFSSYDWIPGNNLQIMDRVDRIGQKHVCEIYFQLFKDTISEYMWKNVMEKEMVINEIIKKEEEK